MTDCYQSEQWRVYCSHDLSFQLGEIMWFVTFPIITTSRVKKNSYNISCESGTGDYKDNSVKIQDMT